MDEKEKERLPQFRRPSLTFLRIVLLYYVFILLLLLYILLGEVIVALGELGGWDWRAAPPQ